MSQQIITSLTLFQKFYQATNSFIIWN